MEENHRSEEGFYREDVPKNRHSAFDDLAKGMASGIISRGQALRMVGAALLGFSSLGSLGGCQGEEAGGPGDQAAKEARSGEEDLQRLEQGKVLYGTSFVNPLIELSGEVYIGEESFVAGNT